MESLERNPTKGATYSSCGVESATGYEGHKKISDLYCLNIDITATGAANLLDIGKYPDFVFLTP